MVIMLPKERTILSMLRVTLWTEQWRVDLHKTYLNCYDRKSTEIVIGVDALWDWIDIACKCPFLHQNFYLAISVFIHIWYYAPSPPLQKKEEINNKTDGNYKKLI